MKNSLKLTLLLPIGIAAVLMAGCNPTPPKPGQEISLPNQGITIKLADGWIGEVTTVDWVAWQRVEKGRSDEPWVFPPVTARNESLSPEGNEARAMNWRFKGVTGTFDPSVSPLTSQYPVPSGLWALDPMKLDLLEDQTIPLPWPGLSGISATARTYEHTHGTGATSALWHTYTVIFVKGPNTYEFVMSIPDNVDYHDWIDQFWASIVDVTIE